MHAYLEFDFFFISLAAQTRSPFPYSVGYLLHLFLAPAYERKDDGYIPTLE